MLLDAKSKFCVESLEIGKSDQLTHSFEMELCHKWIPWGNEKSHKFAIASLNLGCYLTCTSVEEFANDVFGK